jgi:hypothetical protein
MGFAVGDGRPTSVNSKPFLPFDRRRRGRPLCQLQGTRRVLKAVLIGRDFILP